MGVEPAARARLRPFRGDVVEITPAGQVELSLMAPASKSMTNRLLVMAALARGDSTLFGPLVSSDTEAMVSGLAKLGVIVQREAGSWRLSGGSGGISGPAGVIDAGLSGTTLRFLAAVASLGGPTVVIDGSEPLRRRPIAGLANALEALGASVALENGRLPMKITSAGIDGGRVEIDAQASSQFASAILLVAPYAKRDVSLFLHGLGSPGYVDLTVDAMQRWGASVEVRSERHGTQEPWEIFVSSREHYAARSEIIEYDASAAAHLFALGMAAGGRVRVTNASTTSLQPDARILDVMGEMGADVSIAPAGGVMLERLGPLRSVDVDLSAMPDQVSTVAVLASLAEGESRISNVAVSRGHETDRLSATARELSRLGADISELADGLVIRGGKALHGCRVNTYGDHRMAMAFAALGTVVPGVQIADPGCVAKTYPQFWDDIAKAGVALR
ncbi:MAG: 3-phosphoshikimate 1-carboxyvinyltransferase [Actinomycetota bacterium]|nr:3-phosphoshikimate 1-carboxyvinyltransferase [Actinomycetota bacterium]